MPINFKELDNDIAFAAMIMPNDALARQIVEYFSALKAYESATTTANGSNLIMASYALNLGFIEYFKQKYTDDLMNVHIPSEDESED